MRASIAVTVLLISLVRSQQISPLNYVTMVGGNFQSSTMSSMMSSSSTSGSTTTTYNPWNPQSSSTTTGPTTLSSQSTTTYRSGPMMAGTATYTCTGPANQAYTWYIYTPQVKKIYQSQLGYQDPSYQNKYMINGSNSGQSTFTVLNPTLSDGIALSCEFISTDPVYANLIVMDRPTSTILMASTMQPPNSNQPITTGSQVVLQCAINYASPTKDAGFSSISNPTPPTPDIAMYLGNDPIPNPTIIHSVGIPGMPQDEHSLIAQQNFTVRAGDGGKMLKCDVTMSNPNYYDTASTTLNAQTPVEVCTFTATNSINISVSNWTHFYLDNNYQWINCSANGIPTPTVRWVPNSDMMWSNMTNNVRFSGSGQGYYLMQPILAGWYSLNCTATQSGQGMQTVTLYQDIYFIAMHNETGVKSKSSDVGLGVGLGIGLGVPILLGIIILVVILMKRRKSKSPPAYSVKNAESKSKAPKNNNAAAPATIKPVNEKNSRAKRPDPQPPTNSAPPMTMVNNNPNPTYAVAHGGNPGRESPGYGDLGMRQMNGSGSQPQLNQSYESANNRSFDRQQPVGPRYQNGSGEPNTQV